MNPYSLDSELSAKLIIHSKSRHADPGHLVPEHPGGTPKILAVACHKHKHMVVKALLLGFYRHRQNLLVKILPWIEIYSSSK